MADLAGVIQRGTAAQSNLGTTLSSQAASIQQGASQKMAAGTAIDRTALQDRQVTVQEQAMKAQLQGMVDSKNDVLFMGMDNLQKQAAAAKKALDDIPTSLPPGVDPTTPVSVAMTSKTEGERQKAQTAYQAQIDKRNDYVLTILRNPPVMAMLKSGSLADNYIRDQFLSEEIFESMTPSEKEEVIARVTAMKELETQVQTEQAQVQLRSSYATEAYKAAGKAAGEGGDFETPDAAFLSEAAYRGRINAKRDKKEIDEDTAAEWFSADIAPLIGQADAIERMGAADRTAMGTLFELWNPADRSAFDIKLAEYINNNTIKADIGTTVLNSLNKLDGTKSDELNRTGEVINTAKRFMKPKSQFMFGG
jgi:hypothetical protein